MSLSAEDLDELHELCTRLYNLTRRNGYPGNLQVVYRQARAALACYEAEANLPMTGDLR
jgi:hypothetical protein